MTIRNWLDQIPAKHVIGIDGNHDIVFEQTSYPVPKNLKWLYLGGQATEFFGLKIYGTPWQLPFWGAFNFDEDQLVQRSAKIPHDLDIFISHGPPYGIYDEVPHGQHFQFEFLFYLCISSTFSIFNSFAIPGSSQLFP